MGIAENYDDVLKGKYPAKEHARKVAKWIVEKGGDKNGTIYLEAQKQKLNEDNDGEAPFRCEMLYYTRLSRDMLTAVSDNDATSTISVDASCQTRTSHTRSAPTSLRSSFPALSLMRSSGLDFP